MRNPRLSSADLPRGLLVSKHIYNALTSVGAQPLVRPSIFTGPVRRAHHASKGCDPSAVVPSSLLCAQCCSNNPARAVSTLPRHLPSLIHSFNEAAGDPDIDLPTGLHKGAPMGISVPITSPGVVPFIQQPGPSTAADAHTLLVSPDGWTNYRYTEEDPSTCRHLVDKMVSQNIATDFPSWDHLVPTSNQVKSSSIASASSANNGLTRPRNTASFGTSVGQEKTLLHAKLNASSCPGWRTWLTTSWTSPDPPARMNEFSSLAPTLSMPFNKSQCPPR